MTSASPFAVPASRWGSALTRSTIGLFAFVVVAWSLNWVVMKVAVQEVTPLWAVAIRTALAALVLFPSLLAAGQLVWPTRADLPVLLVIALFHMVAFAGLMTAGLVLVPASRAIVLGYTTPLWVAPAAFLCLGERVSARQGAGITLGIAGLLALFKPGSFAWGDEAVLLGNGLVILAALCWSVSIVYTRAHHWVATPLQAHALAVPARDDHPHDPGARSRGCTAAADRHARATGARLQRRRRNSARLLGHDGGEQARAGDHRVSRVLATPVLGIGLSAIILGEGLDPRLVVSALTILFGVALGAKKGG